MLAEVFDLKPASFDYFRCQTVEEATDLLATYGDEAKVLAGGQSLVPMMNMRLARPEVIVDVSRVAELAELRAGSEEVAIGAGVTQRAAERSDQLAEVLPVAREAIGHIGHVPNRSRGTVCGSCAHADAAAELPALMVALEAEMVAARQGESRTIPAADFFRGHFTTALEPEELLVEIRIRPPGRSWGSAFLEVARRQGDFALIAAAALVQLDPEERIGDLQLALANAADVPLRLIRVEEALIGSRPDDAQAMEIRTILAEDIDPPSDVHASSDYRRQVAEVLVRRSVRQAAARASNGSP